MTKKLPGRWEQLCDECGEPLDFDGFCWNWRNHEAKPDEAEVIHVDSPEYKALSDEYERLCEMLNDFIAHAPGREWWGKSAWDEYNGMNDEIKRIDAIIHPSGDDGNLADFEEL